MNRWFPYAEPMDIAPIQIFDKDRMQTLLRDYLTEIGHPTPDAYPYFEHYWQASDRYPYFIIDDEKTTGFVLVNRLSLLNKSNLHAIAEFYILPDFRRKQLGFMAARQTFARHVGLWEVAYDTDNKPAAQFWEKSISRLASSPISRTALDDGKTNVLSFFFL